MGIVSEVMSVNARKPIFGYMAMVGSLFAIAILAFLVWAHHMFVSGLNPFLGSVFVLLTLLIAIPSAIKVFNWLTTIWKGNIRFTAGMMFSLGFVSLFISGGLTGIFLGNSTLDIHLHDTYFVIAHFHYIMVGGMVIAYLAGIHFWWPKISGRMYPEFWGKLAAMIIFVGFNLTFFPQFVLGYMGMPRRYWQYSPEFQVLNVLSTAGATILAVGYVLPMVYLLWSMRYGKLADANPWDAAGLEWTTSSPPTTFNFDETPVVTWEAYNYDELDAPKEVPLER